ncbi:GNAT family N-acetyltransferase [Streptomyces sp. TRM66268-LWL]|uniref:GNAT family N-acetyltransferase n=1 Tax=Streptomyces polyasparticus TaxID=2767826 RepID=A0ABR7SHK5_9ACTN|nr:GNAT family N-acetyltransferase [Streptomyces polyasparticus]MBC9714980.1 GNAT family N-acetyltransferase [Streptomyces polyasparticus]
MTSPDPAPAPTAALLQRIEQYYDAAPRSSAEAEDFGPLTLFVRAGQGFPFYARPTPGGCAEVSADDVRRVRARQRALGVPEAFEWVEETTPVLRAAVEASGLAVHEHPLMVLDPQAAAQEPPGGLVRMLEAGDPALASAHAVLFLAFSAPGTAAGEAGVDALDAETRTRSGDGSVESLAERIEAGLTRVAAAVEDGRALASGRHQPVGAVTEIVGMGTLPAARRRGLAQAVAAALIADAHALGIETVFLSAADEAVARLYARLGFRRVGTALIAEAAS